MTEKIIKDSSNKFRLVFTDNYVAYQEMVKKGIFSKDYAVAREARISYRNVDYFEFNKSRTGTGFCQELEVSIQLITPQPEFRSQTVSLLFSGVFMDSELNPIIKFANSKIK